MVTKAIAAVLGVILVLFLLSVIAPVKSESKFWRMIHKVRDRMDLAVYWFFNICAILIILHAVWVGVRR